MQRSQLWALSCVLAVAACSPQPENTTQAASETDPTEADPTEADPTEADPTEADPTEADPTETDPTGTDTDAPVPEACDQPDPSVVADFSLSIDHWTDADVVSHSVDAACTIVTLEAADHTLSCMVDGQMRVASLSFHAPLNALDYAVGDQVRLLAAAGDEAVYSWRQFELRAADDDRMLALAVAREALDSLSFAPLTVDVVLACGPELEFDSLVTPMQLDIRVPDGPAISIISGQRGLLQSDGLAYEIDVAEASTNNCCHYTRYYELLLRRVVVD